MSSCHWFPLSRRQIREWIDRHPESLPAHLVDLARFPQPFRREMVTMVTPEVRRRLWQEHFESLLGPASPLNHEQQAFVSSTIPELDKILAAPAPNAVMTDWEQRMAVHFTRAEAGKIFMEIGPPEPPEGIALPSDAVPALLV